MTTTAPPARPPSTPAPQPPNPALRGVLLLIGSALLIGLLTVTAVRVVALAGYADQSGMHQVTQPVQSLTVRTSATDVRISFADVPHPQIELDQGRQGQTMRHEVRNGNLLVVVESARRGIGILAPSLSPTGHSVLSVRLPQDLAGADLQVQSSSGQVNASGDFGAVEVDAAAADTELSGSARSLLVNASASDVTARPFAVSGAIRADVLAGGLDFDTPELPSAINVEGAAADVRFELPHGEYQIITHSGASRLTQDVSSTAGAQRVYEFDVLVGAVHLSERP